MLEGIIQKELYSSVKNVMNAVKIFKVSKSIWNFIAAFPMNGSRNVINVIK